MRLHARESLPGGAARPFEAIAADLDACFAGDWRSELDVLVALTGELSRDYVAVRRLIADAAAEGAFPTAAGGRSFWLKRTPRWHLRVNAWRPRPAGGGSERQAHVEVVGDCHNHSFDFITTCLFGSGYQSRFLRQHERVGERFAAGDILPVEPAETIRLRPGDVMVVERDADFHTQEWPESYSLTLNLMPTPEPDAATRTYLIEEGTGRALMVVDAAA